MHLFKDTKCREKDHAISLRFLHAHCNFYLHGAAIQNDAFPQGSAGSCRCGNRCDSRSHTQRCERRVKYWSHTASIFGEEENNGIPHLSLVTRVLVARLLTLYIAELCFASTTAVVCSIVGTIMPYAQCILNCHVTLTGKASSILHCSTPYCIQHTVMSCRPLQLTVYTGPDIEGRQ